MGFQEERKAEERKSNLQNTSRQGIYLEERH